MRPPYRLRDLLLPFMVVGGIGLTPLPALAQSNTKAAGYYEDALTRYEKKDIAGAIIQLKNALQADPNNLSVQLLLGKALLRSGEAAAAEVAFNEAWPQARTNSGLHGLARSLNSKTLRIWIAAL